jgi:hypothetical protein
MKTIVTKYEATQTDLEFKRLNIPIYTHIELTATDINGKHICLKAEQPETYLIIENNNFRFNKPVKIVDHV